MSSPPSPSVLDGELLERIERAFEHHAKGDEHVSLEALKTALDLKSDYLAKRMLACFDHDGDGVVTRAEFVSTVRALVYGSPTEKLAFAFRVHDHDGDGSLDRLEVRRMIALSLAESGVSERATQSPDQLTDRLFEVADRNHDDRLSFEEIEAVVRERPRLFDQMTRSEAIWLSPNEDLLLSLEAKSGPSSRLAELVANRAPLLVFATLWLLANVGVVTWSMTVGRSHATSNHAMELGRASGALLDLNAALIFVPVMRRLLGKLRGSFLGRLVPLDDAIDVHKVLGHGLFVVAVAHSLAFTYAYAKGHAGLTGLVASKRGLTGAVWLATFAVMWLFSLSAVRKSKHFELFYFTHLLYVPWLVLALLHAPRLALFAGVAFVGFVIENVLRWAKRRSPSPVVSTWPLRSGVTRLEITRPKGFTFEAGDFVFLRIPSVAKHEWHPYTISSGPEAPNLVFHVRSLGNWSGAVRALAESKPEKGTIEAYVDGPYGSPSAHIFRSRFVVLIGAGIGVTPFASVLESIVARANAEGTLADNSEPTSLEKVHFFWLNRDAYSFEWFRGMLSRLESLDHRALVDIHLCMTQGRAGATALGLELARDLMSSAGRSDIMTGLRTRTHLGHPDWEGMLGAIARRHAPARVDVFFCGPHGLSRVIEPICHRLGMGFREERF